MSFVNHHLTNLVERDIKTHARQEKKTEMLPLTVDEIDWEQMVLSGKIAKMYLAQLDMYLKEKVCMTPKEIKGKGFTYDLKSEFY